MADPVDPPGTPASPAPPMPAWVKALLGVLALVVAGFVALHLLGAAPTGH